jgi:hypothetical protein
VHCKARLQLARPRSRTPGGRRARVFGKPDLARRRAASSPRGEHRRSHATHSRAPIWRAS